MLILTKVPRGQLIMSGPYALVRHPLYTGVSLLVLPWLGLMFNTWLGIPLGIVMYLFSRRFEASEDQDLSRTFGMDWERYRLTVRVKWL
ncbi:MAG TPA: isoprenylcysteine carboxylmethyltransferase family protein [Chloroflexota bacterium]|nr:isoprenylcysteine carboxylmethyltransferase family protein [Chloroflexota bacterium]